MTPEQYIHETEQIAMHKSKDCWNYIREYIADKDAPATTREQQICLKCNMPFVPTPYSIHGTAGDYENYPEMYLATYLSELWYSKEKYPNTVYKYDLIGENKKYMKMSESEIYDGLVAIEAKYPKIRAFVTYNLLYVAIVSRLPRVIRLVTEWLEQRNRWFTPGAPFEHMSETIHEPSHYKWSGRYLDSPHVAEEGPHNIPSFLTRNDFIASSTNTDITIENWVNGLPYPTPWTDETIEILARALAVNSQQWKTIECSSMHPYPVMTKFVGCICHCILNDTTRIDVLPGMHFMNTPVAYDYNKIVWHTIRSRCSLCIHPHPPESIPTTPYEKVVSRAVNIRRNRLRGVLWCAAVLVGRARHNHYRPGTGRWFQDAQTQFYSNFVKTDS
jgi:hypothetical protein